jgi:hypothetical protein
MRHHCILCGVRLASHTGPLPTTPDKRLDWCHEIRASEPSDVDTFISPREALKTFQLGLIKGGTLYLLPESATTIPLHVSQCKYKREH